MYHLKGDMNIVSRIGGTTVALTNDDIAELKVIENKNAIEYISVETTKDVSAQVNDITNVTHSSTYGDSDYPTNRHYLLDGSDFLDLIYTTIGGAATYPSPAEPPDSGGNYYLDFDGAVVDFYTNDVETGMRILYNDTSGPDTNYIVDVPQSDRVDMPTGATALITPAEDAYVTRNLSNIWKFAILVDTTAAVLDEYFRTSKDILKLKLNDITDFDDLTKRFTVLSNNHRAKSAKIDFVKDEISVDLVQVA
jgi:hypothetical protein